jgi:hypothetical protein
VIKKFIGKFIFIGILLIPIAILAEDKDLTSFESWYQLYETIYNRGGDGEWHKVDEYEAWDREIDVRKLILIIRFAAEKKGQQKIVEIEKKAQDERTKAASEASKKHAELLATVARASL